MNTLQKYEKYLYLIILIGVIVYFPIFFNGFVWDDFYFIINNPQVHQLNLIALFGHNDFNSGPFYRPIPAVYFAFIYTLAGNHAFLYHLFQLILHIVGTSLLFIFLCTFFSEYIAFFLALIFLVHPINVESVAYIGSTQSELYFIPGITALLLAKEKYLSPKKFYLILFLLLLSTLTKEIGFLFFILVIAYRLLYQLGNSKKFTIAAIFMLAFYLCLRIFYSGVTYSMATTIPIASLSLPQRLINIPSILLFYLKTFFFPLSLSIWQFWIVKTANINTFILPLILCALFITILIYLGYSLIEKLKKHKEGNLYFNMYLFFSLWFILGMGPLLQIVPLDMTVADRWFYFPIVGLLGIIGTILSVWIPSFKTHKRQYFWIAAILLLLLSSRAFNRTLDYKNELNLYKHDLQTNKSNYMLLNDYGEDLIQAGKNDEGCNFVKESVDLTPDAPALRELGSCYYDKQNYDDALAAYKQALSLSKGEQSRYIPMIYERMGMTLTADGNANGDMEEGCNYFQRAASLSPTIQNTNELGNCFEISQQYDKAINAYSKALELTQSNSTNDSALPVYLNLAHVYILAKRPQDAINFINNQALINFPDNKDLLSMLAEAKSEITYSQNPKSKVINNKPLPK